MIIASGVVVSRAPTLALVTRNFARQSHAAVEASRNATFSRLCRAVRLGSIPIARSTFRCLACPCVVLRRARVHCLVPTVSMRLQPGFLSISSIGPSVEFVHGGLLRRSLTGWLDATGLFLTNFAPWY